MEDREDGELFSDPVTLPSRKRIVDNRKGAVYFPADKSVMFLKEKDLSFGKLETNSIVKVNYKKIENGKRVTQQWTGKVLITSEDENELQKFCEDNEYFSSTQGKAEKGRGRRQKVSTENCTSSTLSSEHENGNKTIKSKNKSVNASTGKVKTTTASTGKVKTTKRTPAEVSEKKKTDRAQKHSVETAARNMLRDNANILKSVFPPQSEQIVSPVESRETNNTTLQQGSVAATNKPVVNSVNPARLPQTQHIESEGVSSPLQAIHSACLPVRLPQTQHAGFEQAESSSSPMPNMTTNTSKSHQIPLTLGQPAAKSVDPPQTQQLRTQTLEAVSSPSPATTTTDNSVLQQSPLAVTNQPAANSLYLPPPQQTGSRAAVQLPQSTEMPTTSTALTMLTHNTCHLQNTPQDQVSVDSLVNQSLSSVLQEAHNVQYDYRYDSNFHQSSLQTSSSYNVDNTYSFNSQNIPRTVSYANAPSTDMLNKDSFSNPNCAGCSRWKEAYMMAFQSGTCPAPSSEVVKYLEQLLVYAKKNIVSYERPELPVSENVPVGHSRLLSGNDVFVPTASLRKVKAESTSGKKIMRGLIPLVFSESILRSSCGLGLRKSKKGQEQGLLPLDKEKVNVICEYTDIVCKKNGFPMLDLTTKNKIFTDIIGKAKQKKTDNVLNVSTGGEEESTNTT